MQEVWQTNPAAVGPVFFSGVLAFGYNVLQPLGFDSCMVLLCSALLNASLAAFGRSFS